MDQHKPDTVLLRLRIAPDRAGVHALRAVLKRLLRAYGLRCIAIEVETDKPRSPSR